MQTKFALLVAVACAMPLTPAAADVQSNTLKWNGIKLNGLTWNGWSLNGLRFNGLTWNGWSLNGVQFNGTSATSITESDAQPLAVETITLPNGTVIKAR